MNIVSTQDCTFCENEKETVLHLLWYCICVYMQETSGVKLKSTSIKIFHVK